MLIGQVADTTSQGLGGNDSKSCNSNQTRHLKSSVGEMRFGLRDHDIHARNFMMKLGGNHADKPVIVRTRRAAQYKHRP